MLKDKVVLITGGSRGIGKGMAEAFAKEGCHLVLMSKNPMDASQVAALKENYQVEVHSVLGDVSNMNDCLIIKGFVEKHFGLLDILVNNAGITKDNLFIRMTEAEFQQCLDVNLKGTFNMTKVFVKDFMKKRQGTIINLSSVSGVVGNIGQANYAAAKAGIIGFTKSIAKELAARNITCNAIAPGFIETEMTEKLTTEVKTQALTQIPLKRFGKTNEIAAGAIFLAKNSYITGQVLHIDGGMVMHG